MKAKRIVALALAITLGGSLVSTNSASADFATKKYSNCKALNKKYPGGVARSRSVTNSGGATRFTPTVSPKIYKENKSKDRDRDGIACER